MALNLSVLDTVLSAALLLGEHLQPSAGPKASSSSSASSASSSSSASSAPPGPGGAPIRWSLLRGRPGGPGGLPGARPVSVPVPSAGGSGVPRRAGCADPSAPARGAPQRRPGSGERAPPSVPLGQRAHHNKCQVFPQRNLKEK